MFTDNRKKQLTRESARRYPEAADMTPIVSGYICNELRDRTETGVWLTVEISFFTGKAFQFADHLTAFFPDDSRFRCTIRKGAN